MYEGLTKEDRIIRGAKARAVLKDEMVSQGFDELHQVLHLQLDNMPTDDTKAITSIVSQLRGIKAIKAKLQAWADDGERLERNE